MLDLLPEELFIVRDVFRKLQYVLLCIQELSGTLFMDVHGQSLDRGWCLNVSEDHASWSNQSAGKRGSQPEGSPSLLGSAGSQLVVFNGCEVAEPFAFDRFKSV